MKERKSELREEGNEVVLDEADDGLGIAADEEHQDETFEVKSKGKRGKSDAETERADEKDKADVGEDRAKRKSLVGDEIQESGEEITDSFEHGSTSFLFVNFQRTQYQMRIISLLLNRVGLDVDIFLQDTSNWFVSKLVGLNYIFPLYCF